MPAESPKVNGAALLAGSERAKQQLRLAATITAQLVQNMASWML